MQVWSPGLLSMRFGSMLFLIGAVLSVAYSAVAADRGENLYQTLGVKSTASQKDIRKAFRKLAMKYHPDRNKDPNAEKEFQKIARAYEILSNEETREGYDRFRTTDNTNNMNEAFNFNEFFRHFDGAHDFRGYDGGGGEKTDRKQENQRFSFSFGLDDLQVNFDDLKPQRSAFENIFGGDHDAFHSIFSDFFGDLDHVREVDSGHSDRPHTGRHCKTITEKRGNMIQEHIVCS